MSTPDPAPGPVPLTAEQRLAAERKRERAASGMLSLALILEALTVLFVPQTVARVSEGGLTNARLGWLLGLAGLLFVVAFVQRSAVGVALGTVLQLAVIATGTLVGVMYVLGLVFACVWAYLLWGRQEIRRAIERDRGTPEAAPPA